MEMEGHAVSPVQTQEWSWVCPSSRQTGVPPTYQCSYQTEQSGPANTGPGPPDSLPTPGPAGFQGPPQRHPSSRPWNGVLSAESVSKQVQSPVEGGSPPASKMPSPVSESRYGLDPQLLPSAVHVMKEDQTEWEGKVFVSEPPALLPPLSSTDCAVEDRGNASPRFIRCTSYCFPCEGQVAQQGHLPLAAIVTPLAQLHPTEPPVPVCREEESVKGCSECGAFMCPAMNWQCCGQRFYCPFCGKLTEVSWQFFQPADAQGRRLDTSRRAELSLGSYEILESGKGEAAGILLAIDVSAASLRSGQLKHICQHLASFLQLLHREEGTDQPGVRVGMMTYDHRIHLYNLSPALSRPHMMIITEMDQIELPVQEGLLVPLKDCIHTIESILQQIPVFDAETVDTSLSHELPVSTGLKIFQATGCPGKLLMFHSSPLRQDVQKENYSGFFSSSKTKTLFQPNVSAVSLAKACASQGCSVHLFLFCQEAVGGAWPGHVPFLTGGGLLSYSSLQSEVEGARLSWDLRRTVEADTAYRVRLRVFVNKELCVSGCYGSIIPAADPGCVAMAALDRHTCLAIELTHRKPLDEARGMVIQVALSYTSAGGERRTRVHTVSLPCSRLLLDMFRKSQAETLLTFYCKRMYCAVVERPLQTLREELQTEVTQLLACYRKHSCTTSVSPGQLVLPSFLKTLPVYVNSLRKSEVLLPGLRSSIHQRLQMCSQVVSMDTRNTVAHFYPLVIPLLPLSQPDWVEGEAIRCSASSLEPGGMFLLYSPPALLLWVGHSVPCQAVMELFGSASFSLLQSGEIKMPELDNQLSVGVRNLINRFQSRSLFTLMLRVVKQGEGCEEAVQRLLVEDKSPNGGASYADFLYHLHVNSLRLFL
ncbi:protein transport protein Sec24C isoform X2 [Denticeps clupeoides]|nr:protein transport protein Sec24C-like isoform X2 [Denticeps clupeoides]